MFLNVGVHVQLGEVVGRPHEHAATSLQPALLVREAEGLHELVDVDATILVAVDGDGQIRDGVVRDLHLQVDAQQLPGLPEVLHANETCRWWSEIEKERGKKGWRIRLISLSACVWSGRGWGDQ